jgi:hypothetical protein
MYRIYKTKQTQQRQRLFCVSPSQDKRRNAIQNTYVNHNINHKPTRSLLIYKKQSKIACAKTNTAKADTQ